MDTKQLTLGLDDAREQADAQPIKRRALRVEGRAPAPGWTRDDEEIVEYRWRLQAALETRMECRIRRDNGSCNHLACEDADRFYGLLAQLADHMKNLPETTWGPDSLRIKIEAEITGSIAEAEAAQFPDLKGRGRSKPRAQANLLRQIADHLEQLDASNDDGGEEELH